MTHPALRLPELNPVTDDALLIQANYESLLRSVDPSTTVHFSGRFDDVRSKLYAESKTGKKLLHIGIWTHAVGFMKSELEEANPQTWLDAAQKGEVALIIKQAGSGQDGKWQQLTVRGTVIQRVTATTIEAGNQLYSKTPNAQGYSGTAPTAALLRPVTQERAWQLKARLHAAYHALLMHANPPEMLLDVINHAPESKWRDAQFIQTLELIINQRRETEALISSFTTEFTPTV